MPKDFLADISTGFALITSGPLLFLNSSSLGLETALGIFYMFFGFSVALASGKTVIALSHKPDIIAPELPSGLNLKTRLALEKARYHQIEFQQAQRFARICNLEAQIAKQNPNPYRMAAN